MQNIIERKDCRACHGQLEFIFHFGEHEAINFGDKDPVKSPLELMKCQSCHLVQLHHTVNPDLLFRKYYYRSGVNQTMRNHLQELAQDILKRSDGTLIVDIGANDGTFLSFFKDKMTGVGFEPSQLEPNIVDKPEYWVHDFFSAKAYDSFYHLAKADVVNCTAMFYDLDDPGKFLDDVKQVLAPDGLFVIEMNYLPAMLEGNRVDNISAEHLCYYSISSLAALIERHGLEVNEVQFDEINGGVFRVYVRHQLSEAKGVSIESSFGKALTKEAKLELDKLDTYHKFIRRVQTNMRKLNQFIQKEARNLKVDCYGASTRGLMLMQLAHLDQTNIRQAVERNPAKVGTKYNGIPVVDEQTMRDSPPHYLLILAPDFVSEFYVREKKFLQNGGKFIIPFPTPYILSLEAI